MVRSNERYYFLDRHAKFGAGLLGSLAGKDALGAFLHGGIGSTKKLVRVDYDVNSDCREFGFGHPRVGGGDNHYWLVSGDLVAEAPDKRNYLIRGLRLGVNHYAIGTGFDIGTAAGDGVVFASAGNERLAAGDDHEVVRYLGLLADLDLVALVFDRGLLLNIAGLKERVLLKSYLVLDDDRRYTKTLKGSDEEHEVFGKAAGVAIIYDRLGGYFKDVVHRAKAGGDVDGLVVGLALEGGVRKRREPHGVELVLDVVFDDGGVLDDEPGESAMGLHNANDWLGVQETAKAATADVGGGADFADRLV